MKVDAPTLRSALSMAMGSVEVEPMSAGAYRVLVPTGRLPHDWSVLAAEEVGDSWVISDGGYMRELLGEDFDDVLDAVICAGAPFVAQGPQLIAQTTSENLVDTVAAYAHHLSAMTVVWQTDLCRDAGNERATSPLRIMADRMHDEIVRHLALPAHAHFVRVYSMIAARGERVQAPLCIKGSPEDMRPVLISSFIDMTASSAAVRSAKQRTSFLYDVVTDLAIPKFVVVRGTTAEIGQTQALYDERNITVLADDEPDLLIAESVEAVRILVRG